MVEITLIYGPCVSRLLAATLVSMTLLAACSSTSQSKFDDPGDTTVPRTKNAALNWSIQTPTGTKKPSVTIPGLNVRPVRD